MAINLAVTPRRAAAAVVLSIVLSGPLAAQEAEHDASELAKQTQNPVSDLVSLPFQFNFNSGGGLEDQTFFLLNFQPVVPISVSANWKVIARTIVPIASLPSPAGARYSGIGDIQEQLYFTPAKSGGIIWGIGPVLSFPTSTNDLLRTGSWSAGPGAVVVKMAGPFVLGGLVNQYWPFHDDGGDPEADQLVLQPFINYNFGKGWALAFGPLITANWNAEKGQQWTVPLGLGITRTTVFNRRPMSLGVQYYYNVERPDGAASSQLRFIVSLLFPSGPSGK